MGSTYRIAKGVSCKYQGAFHTCWGAASRNHRGGVSKTLGGRLVNVGGVSQTTWAPDFATSSGPAGEVWVTTEEWG